MSLKDKQPRLWVILFLGFVVSLNAGYYQPDFFPIGLSGIMSTGEGSWSCPYGNVDNVDWTWQKERQLITALGANCLGCADIKPSYLIDLKPQDPSTYNYLHQVCRGVDKETQRGIILA